jgi:hypothetical protein
MNNREAALQFVKSFCAGDVDGLAPMLADDLRFSGPFFQFASADAYLNNLRDDPPEKCGYRVLSVTEGADSVSIYYDYEKVDGAITIAQLFKFADDRISEILLVFDGRGLT